MLIFNIHLCFSTTEFRLDLSNEEISNPELRSLYPHMDIYKTFLLVETRLHLIDIGMKSLNGNKLRIAFK